MGLTPRGIQVGPKSNPEALRLHAAKHFVLKSEVQTTQHALICLDPPDPNCEKILFDAKMVNIAVLDYSTRANVGTRQVPFFLYI